MNALLRPLAALVLLLALAPGAHAQLFDRIKEAAKRTVGEATRAAKETALEEGMNEATMMLVPAGGLSGTAAPWLDGTETLAVADVGGSAYVAQNQLALVVCQAGALDGLILQGRFSGERQTLDLADGGFKAFLAREGRMVPIRAARQGTMTGGTLTLTPGDGGGVNGALLLTLGEDTAARGALPELFERSRVVEFDLRFRAQPAESIAGIACE